MNPSRAQMAAQLTFQRATVAAQRAALRIAGHSPVHYAACALRADAFAELLDLAAARPAVTVVRHA